MSPHPWNQPLWDKLMAQPDRLPHALLLHGAKGIGKKALAMALAGRLLCERPAGGEACCQCAACNWFEQGSHPDFKLIEPAELAEAEAGSGKKSGRVIAIQEIRGLGEYLSLAAHQGGWRVVVLHPAEAMNTPAANALLKTLEEPPARVLLILVSHQPKRLLPTVLSRCRRLAVPLPDPTQALDWLMGKRLEDAAALLRESGGAPLLALECADSDRQTRRERFLEGLSQPTPLALSELAQEYQNRLDEAWGWFSRWVHDLMRIKQRDRARYFPERASPLERLAATIPLSGLMALEDDLRRAGRWLRHPLNGQLLLESWLLRYAEIVKDSHGR